MTKITITPSVKKFAGDPLKVIPSEEKWHGNKESRRDILCFPWLICIFLIVYLGFMIYAYSELFGIIINVYTRLQLNATNTSIDGIGSGLLSSNST